MKSLVVFTFSICLWLSTFLSASAQPPPFELLERIATLEDQVASLQAAIDAPNQIFSLDCGAGESISEALAAGYRKIEFSGTCVEDLYITDSGVTLRGFGAANSIISGYTQVVGATGVEMTNFSVSELDIWGGAFARIDNMTIESLLNVNLNSGALINGLVISATNPSGFALLVGRSSHVNMSGGIINGEVNIFNDSSLRAPLNVITGSISVARQSLVELKDSFAMSDLISIDLDSVLWLNFFGEIEGDIEIGRDSAVVFDGVISFNNGTLTCLDTESSYSGSFSGSGAVDASCTGYDSPAN